jgi:hypothetical protein
VGHVTLSVGGFVVMTLLGAGVCRADDRDARAPIETDLLTVLAIGIDAYTTAALLHEGLGHELGCAIGGDRPRGFSTAVASCDVRDMTPGGKRILLAGGAAVNLITGAGAATALALAPPTDGASYYFLWLSSAVNLFQAGGYLMLGPWLPIGDFGTKAFVEDLDPRLPWQIGLSALGVAITTTSLFAVNALSEPLLGSDPAVRSHRRLALTLWPYLVGAGVVSLSGLLSRAGPEFAVSAAVANFAGTLFIAYIPLFFGSDFFYPAASHRPDQALSIERTRPHLYGLSLPDAAGTFPTHTDVLVDGAVVATADLDVVLARSACDLLDDAITGLQDIDDAGCRDHGGVRPVLAHLDDVGLCCDGGDEFDCDDDEEGDGEDEEDGEDGGEDEEDGEDDGDDDGDHGHDGCDCTRDPLDALDEVLRATQKLRAVDCDGTVDARLDLDRLIRVLQVEGSE